MRSLGNPEDIAAIRQLARRWRAGWLAGDADELVSLYGRRPVLMAQGRPALFGKAAIRTLYRSVLREIRVESEGALREVRAAGDWGYFWSTYTLRVTPRTGGRATRCKGKSVFIVNRQRDGQWKIVRLIDNSDRALA